PVLASDGEADPVLPRDGEADPVLGSGAKNVAAHAPLVGSFDVRSSRRVLAAIALVALLAAPSRETRADTASDLEKAHSAYVAHEYSDAEKRLRALLEQQSERLDPDSLADARMYLGAVLLAEGRRNEADAVFEQLLLDKPDYQPDPL